jgi:hypothetical protein
MGLYLAVHERQLRWRRPRQRAQPQRLGSDRDGISWLQASVMRGSAWGHEALYRVTDRAGSVLADARFAATPAGDQDLATSIHAALGGRQLQAIGVELWSVDRRPALARYGLLATPKPGWSGFDHAPPCVSACHAGD